MTPEELLSRVREVEAFVASCRTDEPGRATWSRTPSASKSSPRTFYHGSAGVLLFLLEIHRTPAMAHHAERVLDEAVRAGDEIIGHLDGPDAVTIGFHSGLPGYVFVLNELAKASGEPRFREAAQGCLDRMTAQSQPLGAGIGWIEPMPFADITGISDAREVLDLSIGAAGAGLAYLYAHRQGFGADSLGRTPLGLATLTADRLLEMATHSAQGCNWLMAADMPFPFTAPNFAHGAAGVGYFMADLYRATGTPSYLEAALAAAEFVKAHTTPSGQGHLVCHTAENNRLFYLGVCHGPPGTDRLMVLLAEITDDAGWLDWAHANMVGLMSTGAPEVRSRGLWENRGQCCGDAGIGDFAVSMYRATGRPEYRNLADRVAASIIDASEFDNGRRWWIQAEHRNRPDFVEVQTGYMQGAAGIGSFLLHLATIDDETSSKIAHMDSPFVH